MVVESWFGKGVLAMNHLLVVLLVVAFGAGKYDCIRLTCRMKDLTYSMPIESIGMVMELMNDTEESLRELTGMVNFTWTDLRPAYFEHKISLERLNAIRRLNDQSIIKTLVPIEMIQKYRYLREIYVEELAGGGGGPLGMVIIAKTETDLSRFSTTDQIITILEHLISKQRNLVESQNFCKTLFANHNDDDEGDGILHFLKDDLWKLFDATCLDFAFKGRSIEYKNLSGSLATRFTQLGSTNFLAMLRLANLCYSTKDKELLSSSLATLKLYQGLHNYNGNDWLVKEALTDWSGGGGLLGGEKLENVCGILSNKLDWLFSDGYLSLQDYIPFKFELAFSADERGLVDMAAKEIINLLGRYGSKDVAPFQSQRSFTILKRKSSRISDWRRVVGNPDWLGLSKSKIPNVYLPPLMQSKKSQLSTWRRRVSIVKAKVCQFVHNPFKDGSLTITKLSSNYIDIPVNLTLRLKGNHTRLWTEYIISESKRILDEAKAIKLNLDGVLLFNCKELAVDSLKRFWVGRITALSTEDIPLPMIHQSFFQSSNPSSNPGSDSNWNAGFLQNCIDSKYLDLEILKDIVKLTIQILEKLNVPKAISYNYTRARHFF